MISRSYLAIISGLLLIPGTALAHSPIEGINKFYNGILHPVFIPAQILLLVATGLFIGQQGPKEIQVALVAFLGAVLMGLVIAWFSPGIEMGTILLSFAAAIGILIAINPTVGQLGCMLVAVVVGFSLGMDSAQETLSGKDKLASLFGSAVGIYFILLFSVNLAEYFNSKTWQKIGLRVFGSWVAAASLMVLALTFASKP